VVQTLIKNQSHNNTAEADSQVPSCSGCVGYSCRRCRKEDYKRRYPQPPLLVPNGCKSAENNLSLKRKKNRFLVRAFRGVTCGLSKGYRFRWFVLTESDEALSSGREFGREFHLFITWLRYFCRDFQYIAVEHRQGNKQRRNWHILSYGSDKLPIQKMREYWLSHYLSTVTGMAEVKDIDKAIKYLAGYLSSGDKFVRSFQSQGWVFRGWVSVSRQYHSRYGDYPSSKTLATLSLMSRAVRPGELDWLNETGYLSREYSIPVGGHES